MRIVTYALLLCLPTLAFSQTQHFQLNIPYILCHKKTGDGPDALYLLVTWKSKRGVAHHQRLPFNGHYTINDTQHPDLNAAPASLDLGSMAGFDLGGDDYVDVLCSIMEQDDGTPEQYNEVGRQVINLAMTPGMSIYNNLTGYLFKEMLANVAKKYHLKNADDWVGSCSYRISRQAGALRVNFKQIHNPNSSGGYAQAAGACMPGERKPVDVANANTDFSFSGDGASYELRVTVSR